MNSFFNEYKSRGIYILYVLLWLVLLIIKLIEFTTAIDIKYSVAYIVQCRYSGPFIACVSLSPNVVALQSRAQL